MNIQKLKLGSEIQITSSVLGANGEIGKIIAIFGSEEATKLKVDFDGKIGIYTISKHKIEVKE